MTLPGDAAHPMYPMGSNGAGQAILDAANLSDHLASHTDPSDALRAYQDDRLPVTSEVVLRNRKGGPENVIDEVERRPPTASPASKTSSTPRRWRPSSTATPRSPARPKTK